MDVVPVVAFLHPVDEAVVVGVGSCGVAVYGVGGACLDCLYYLWGACEVHVGDPEGEDVLHAGALLSVAPLAGAGWESVYDCVEVIHHGDSQ